MNRFAISFGNYVYGCHFTSLHCCRKLQPHLRVAPSWSDADRERLVRLGLKTLGLTEESLGRLKMNCSEKYAVAWLARRNTCVRNDWIVQRLSMGNGTNITTFLKRMGAGDFGAAYLKRIKSVVN